MSTLFFLAIYRFIDNWHFYSFFSINIDKKIFEPIKDLKTEYNDSRMLLYNYSKIFRHDFF